MIVRGDDGVIGWSVMNVWFVMNGGVFRSLFVRSFFRPFGFRPFGFPFDERFSHALLIVSVGASTHG